MILLSGSLTHSIVGKLRNALITTSHGMVLEQDVGVGQLLIYVVICIFVLRENLVQVCITSTNLANICFFMFGHLIHVRLISIVELSSGLTEVLLR